MGRSVFSVGSVDSVAERSVPDLARPIFKILKNGPRHATPYYGVLVVYGWCMVAYELRNTPGHSVS